MKRTVTTLGFGGALFAAALLVACGGGGGGSSSLPNSGSPNGPVTTDQLGTTKITIHLPPRNVAKHPHGVRRRNYVSVNAQGLQVAVTSGSTTQTVYANISDIATPSPLCTGGEGPGLSVGQTCTITVPVVGANETIVATEVDQPPTAQNPTTGYGTGFPVTSNVLAVGTGSATLTGSVQQITLSLNPVVAQLLDCGYSIGNANFSIDYSLNRIVVTAGVPATGQMDIGPLDASGQDLYVTPSPLPSGATAAQPFVDVNGSATPITFNSSSTSVTLAVAPNPSPASSPATTQTGSVSDTSNLWYQDCMFFNVNVSASLSTPAPGASPPTVTFANNLSAALPSPFTHPAYTNTLQYTVVPVSASPASVNISTGAPATVTGYDYGISTTSMVSSNCVGSAAATLTAGAMSATTGLQPWTVTKSGSAMGTCTFFLHDNATGVVTNTVTVNVGP